MSRGRGQVEWGEGKGEICVREERGCRVEEKKAGICSRVSCQVEGREWLEWKRRAGYAKVIGRYNE